MNITDTQKYIILIITKIKEKNIHTIYKYIYINIYKNETHKKTHTRKSPP